MAFRKSCDNCERLVDRSDQPFIQIHLHGSISEQVEHENGDLQFRYLTERDNMKVVFCNGPCFLEWLDKQRQKFPFQWK